MQIRCSLALLTIAGSLLLCQQAALADKAQRPADAGKCDIAAAQKLLQQKNYQGAISCVLQLIQASPNDAQLYTMLGSAYCELHKWRDARSSFDSAIALKPSADAYLTRASISLVMEHYSDCMADIDRGLKLNPKNAEFYAMKASVAFKQNNLPGALSAFNEAIRVAPNNVDFYVTRGDIYNKLGDLPRAIKDFTHVIEMRPSDAKGYQRRATVEYDALQTEKAIDDATRAMALRRGPKDTLPYNTRGLSWARLNQPKKAVADVSQAIALDPAPIFLANRGSIYLLTADYDKAIADFSYAVERDPRYVIGFFSRGIAYEGKGDFEKAATDYTKAIALEPSPKLYRRRGQAYYVLKRYDRALADFKTANSLELDFNDDYYMSDFTEGKAAGKAAPTPHRTTTDELIMAALSAEAKDDFKKAILILTEALEGSYANVTARAARARLYMLTDKLNRAIDDLTIALSVSYVDSNLYMERGTAYLAAQKYAAAAFDFDRAIAANTRLALARYYRALCLDRQGKGKEARVAYLKFVTLANEQAEAQRQSQVSIAGGAQGKGTAGAMAKKATIVAGKSSGSFTDFLNRDVDSLLPRAKKRIEELSKSS